jgi:hypothetical protein
MAVCCPDEGKRSTDEGKRSTDEGKRSTEIHRRFTIPGNIPEFMQKFPAGD